MCYYGISENKYPVSRYPLFYIKKKICLLSLSLTDILDFCIETQKDRVIFHAIAIVELLKGKYLREKGYCKAKEDLETTQQSHIATRKSEIKVKF